MEDKIESKIFKLENFILQVIENRKSDLRKLQIERNDYTELDYQILFNRYNAAINDLYIVLTSYDSKYEEFVTPITQRKKSKK